MRKHLGSGLALALLVALSAPLAALADQRHPLSGPFFGIMGGHMESGSTVRWLEAGAGPAGQINDV